MTEPSAAIAAIFHDEPWYKHLVRLILVAQLLKLLRDLGIHPTDVASQGLQLLTLTQLLIKEALHQVATASTSEPQRLSDEGI